MKLKYLSLAGFVLSFLCTGGLAQDATADPNKLNRQVLALVQQGKFDEAIPVAEKVARIERSRDPQSDMYVFALTNLGVLQKEHYSRLKKPGPDVKITDLKEFASKLKKRAEGAEKNFRAALVIYQTRNQYDSLEAAAVKNELAWILSNQVAKTTTEDSRARIDEAERLYTEALVVREKLAGSDSDVTLGSVLEFGDFYKHWINFEKALPLYEQYVAAIEKKHGTSAKALVPGLRGLLEILVITMQDDAAKEMAKRITSITGRHEPVPGIYPQLGLRARTIAKATLPRFPDADRRELFPAKSGARSMSETDNSLRGAGQMEVPAFRFSQVVLAIVVDEEGNVIEVRNLDSNVKGDRAIEEAVRKWKFRPFVYKGVARKMRGAVYHSR